MVNPTVQRWFSLGGHSAGANRDASLAAREYLRSLSSPGERLQITSHNADPVSPQSRPKTYPPVEEHGATRALSPLSPTYSPVEEEHQIATAPSSLLSPSPSSPSPHSNEGPPFNRGETSIAPKPQRASTRIRDSRGAAPRNNSLLPTSTSLPPSSTRPPLSLAPVRQRSSKRRRTAKERAEEEDSDSSHETVRPPYVCDRFFFWLIHPLIRSRHSGQKKVASRKSLWHVRPLSFTLTRRQKSPTTPCTTYERFTLSPYGSDIL